MDREAPAVEAGPAGKQLNTQRPQMGAKPIRPTGARCDARWAAPTAAGRSWCARSVASLPAAGQPMAARTRRHRMVWFSPAGTVRGGGGSAKYGIPQGPGGGAEQGGGGMRRMPDGAFSASRATTPCNCQGPGADGWGARSCRRRPNSALPTNLAGSPCKREGAGSAGRGVRSCRRRRRGAAREGRTTPHATGDGPAGRDGHRGAVGSRAGAGVRWPRTTPHATGDGGWTGWTPRCGRFPGWRGGPLASDDTPCNGRWFGWTGWTPRCGRFPGRRGGPLASDDTPCNGRWFGWTGWTPRCGRFPGWRGGPLASDDTPCNGRWRLDGMDTAVRSVPGRGAGVRWPRTTPHATGGGSAGRDGHRGAVGSRGGAGGRWPRTTPHATGDGGWTGWTPRCGRFPGRRGGPLASDDTPCNGRWPAGRDGHRGALGSRAGAGVRWPRTTPHATRGGSAGRDGHLGALGARAGGRFRRPRTTPHTTGDGAVGRYGFLGRGRPLAAQHDLQSHVPYGANSPMAGPPGQAPGGKLRRCSGLAGPRGLGNGRAWPVGGP